MRAQKLSTVRKFLMWWFRWPDNPYVTITGAIDFSQAAAYLRALPRDGGAEVTVNHLAAAAVARILREFPQANARIVRNRIHRLEQVDVVMPVNLLGCEAGAGQELSLAHLEAVGRLSLRQLAERCARVVSEERAGKPQHPWVKYFVRLAERAPFPVVARGLDALEWLSRVPVAAELLNRRIPVSTCVSNPGAVFGPTSGALLRAISVSLPHRLFHLGTLWGLSSLQDEVVAVDGQAVVRPVLPIVFVFDHRLFDGLVAAQMLNRLAEILADPAATFGVEGARRG